MQAASNSRRTAGPKRLQEQPPPSLQWTPGGQAVHLSAHESLYNRTQTEKAMSCMQNQRRSSWGQVRQTGEYIKVHKNQLLQSVRGPQPELALQSFYGHMSSLCSRPGAFIGPSHLNAIIGATGKAWTLARARLTQQKREHAHHQMHAFLTGIFSEVADPAARCRGTADGQHLVVISQAGAESRCSGARHDRQLGTTVHG